MKLKKKILFASLMALWGYSNISYAQSVASIGSFSPDGIPFVVASNPWKAHLFGNHRAVVEVMDKADVVKVILPWRRADVHPETKKIIVVDAENGTEIQNVYIKEITAERGELYFQPIGGKKRYYVYYLPYHFRKGWDDARYGEPWNDYLPALYDAELKWVKKVESTKKIKEATLLYFESRSDFDRLAPMGIIATANETEKIRAQHTENPIIFLEDRLYPISQAKKLPARWAAQAVHTNFQGNALRNEYYVWQLGLWAAHAELKSVRLSFSDLKSGAIIIPKEEITCFNQEGTNWDGKPITFDVNIPKEQIQAMWCGVQIPADAKPGVYNGTVTVHAAGVPEQHVDISIQVGEELLADCGDSDLWRHSRLRWLNSTIGMDLEPVAPYESLKIDGNQILATDKKVNIASNGLLQSVTLNNRELFVSPMAFIVDLGDKEVTFQASNLRMHTMANGLVEWEATSEQEGLSFEVKASMEYDGYIRYNVLLSSKTSVEVQDIKLISSYGDYASKYFMGIGYKGGFTPSTTTFQWDGPYDSYWIGNEMIGAHIEYRGGIYHGPLMNDYKPAPTPVWSNNKRGSVSLTTHEGRATVIASTGKNRIESEPLDFEFSMLLTPVRKLNTAKHFSERYFHSEPANFSAAANELTNVANIHHARSLNPVINYPFIVRDSLVSFINEQHEQGRKVKLYYTVRELTNYVKEIHALHSLNHEIFVSGRGYGIPWFQEHLIEDYKAAWYTELPGETSDAALVLNSFSRWINYYLEGLKWMIINYQIDGIYMDDVSFDRQVMKRMRKIFAEYRPESLVDLHSNTDYSKGPMNQYTDFFPYIDRLWFGEHFRYNEMSPDEWFVTFSGIPFGLMSEMLQDGGNRFLGMLYGTTSRHSYESNGKYYNPYPIWKLWNEFGIEDAQMIGYWNEACPVSTQLEEVKATVYQKEDKLLIALGNFSSESVATKLSYDWKALGIDSSKAKLIAPAIDNFQEEAIYSLDEAIEIQPKEGKLLILSE
ncbi:MAG: glycoside hydrolase domain-containing protein [Phocaeicola sp.]